MMMYFILLTCVGRFWRHKWLLVGLVFAVIFQVSCAQRGQSVVPPDVTEPASASDASYTFTPGDVVEVMVWKNPDLSREVTVRSDGKISLPLIGDVHAAGFTTEALSDAVIQKLLTYYQDPPAVSIIVKKATPAAIYVLGEVANQGRFEVANGTTLLQAIALAGGFSEFASRNNIIMRRKGVGGEEITLGFRYKDVLAGREKNVVVQHGDTLIVQ